MRLIAIDAAPGVPSVCLQADGVSAGYWRGEPRAAPRAPIDALRNLLTDARLTLADLDIVACGRGPGAFTGVRLALALAQGLALGSGRPLVAVSDLAALAWQARCKHGWPRVIACMDARQGEVYWGGFACDATRTVALTPEAVGPPDEVALPPGDWAIAGSGAAVLTRAGFALAGADAGLVPDAEAVAALAGPLAAAGRTYRPEAAMPVYLRTRVAGGSPGGHNSSVT